MNKLLPFTEQESDYFKSKLNFPNHWIVEAAHFAFDEVRDGTHDSPKPFENGVPLVTSKNLKLTGIDFSNVTLISHSDHAEIFKRSAVKSGDVLFSMIGTVGNVSLVGVFIDFSIKNVGLFRSNHKCLLPLYSYYWLKSESYQKYLDELKRGGNQKFVSLGILRSSPVPIAPLAEQQQIAAKLDQLLAQVDNLKTRLDNIPKILKRFRQSVLAAAISGKLTEDWRELNRNIKFLTNAVELDDFRGNKLSTLPESWQWLTFDQVASVASNLHDPLLTPNAFHIAPNHIESGTGKLLEYTTIANDKVTSAKHQFYSGQILYSKIRPYLCKVAIATFQGLCSADMYPIDAKINTQFLFRWMLSHQFTDWASNAESRSVLPKINQKDLGVIPVPTPPLEEQTEIVARVEQLFTYADQIEQRVKDAQSRVNHLTQAILAKAFRGELTAEWRAQNPELISGENSAKALLARIKAEREMVAKPKKMGKKVNA